MTLLVGLDQPWIADVGFGDSFVEPLQLQPNQEQEQFGRCYRITAEGERYRYEVREREAWKPEYSFTLQPRQLSDFAAMCRYHQTSPDSHFTRNSICSMATPNGRITLSGDRLIETHSGQCSERLVSENERAAILSGRFGITLSMPQETS
jgi:N-hydroxyarylamine O-acetyltransferase